MRASFPSQRVTVALLWGAGIPVLAGILATAPHINAAIAGALWWYLPALVAIGAGLVAFRVRPDSLAARRLVVFGVVGSAFNLVDYEVVAELDSRGGGGWIAPAAIAAQVLGLALGAALVAVLAVYPDGAYHHRHEPVIVRGLAVLVLVVPVLTLLASPTIRPPIIFEWVAGQGHAPFPEVASPLHVGWLSFLDGPTNATTGFSFSVAPLLGAAIIGWRYQRFRAERRLQIRWPMYGAMAGILIAVEAILWQFTDLPEAFTAVLEIGALVIISGSVVIGLVKPDLFDVDRAMRRSLVYVPLWVAIAAVYVAVAALLGLAAGGQGLEVAVIVAIVATVTFEPVRRYLVGRAGAWAFGEPLGGDELVRRLGSTLEHTLDLRRLSEAVATTAREGLGVRWVQIDVDGEQPVADGDPGDGELAAMSAPLVHADRQLGEISCGPRVRGRLRGTDEDLFETLARQTALAVHNARLAGELTASRSRIVAAQETARRQIERDIHDGSQQELVALIARIGLAQNQLRRGDAVVVGETLASLRSEAAVALRNLRDLAAGIHPTVLTDHGLVVAVESLAARSGLEVSVRSTPDVRGVRFDPPVEGGAYFFVSEALTNAHKHAGTTRVRVAIARSGDLLEVAVCDEGTGFDPERTRSSGLGGLADRLAALGGRLDVDSTPGSGTTLTARLPGQAHHVV